MNLADDQIYDAARLMNAPKNGPTDERISHVLLALAKRVARLEKIIGGQGNAAG